MSLRDNIQIMVVDDMATSREFIINALDRIGIKNIVIESQSPVALERLLAKPAQLVISDHNMPGLNGLGLLRKLRDHPLTKEIGFIMTTSKPTKDMLTLGRQLRLNNLIRKPFSDSAMCQCIEKVVGPL